MRRITLWFISTVTLVVLVFSYRTSTSGPASTSAAATANAPGIVSGDAAGAPPSGAAPAPTSATTPGPATGPTSGPAPAKSTPTVVNGSVADTRWGPVQVQVSISGSAITEVTVLQQPSGNNRDYEINSYALPQLRQEALQAQSANIDGVSGATVTSDGYRESLQAALDTVHFVH